MPRVRPCGPLCGLVGAREGKDSGPGDLERFCPLFGAPKAEQEKLVGSQAPRQHHFCPQCEQFRSVFRGVMKAKKGGLRGRKN